MVVSIGSTIAVSWSRGTALVKWRVWTLGLNGVEGVEEMTRSRDGTWGVRTGWGKVVDRVVMARVLIVSRSYFP